MKRNYILTLTLLLYLMTFLTYPALADFEIILNFDDGYQGVYQNAFPVMKKEKITGVIFVPTNFIGKKNHLTLDQLHEIKEAGWEIGSHTIHHPDLSLLTRKGLEREIIDSKKYLEEHKLIDQSYASFCSPMTVWNEKIEKIVGSNYQLARAKALLNFTGGVKQEDVSIRVVVRSTKISTIKNWIRKSKKKDIPLILVFHEIARGGNEYYFSPDRFNELLQVIKNYKIITYQKLYGPSGS